MGVLTLYAIKSAICLAILYLPFTLLLRRETFFGFNRCGLLLIVILSIVVPCLDIPLWNISLDNILEHQRQAVVEVGMPVAVTGDVPATASQGVAIAHGWNWAHLLVYTYMIGWLVCLIVKGRQLYRLLRFIPSGCLWTDCHDGVTIYCHAGDVSAFSWMRSIVVGEADSAPDSPIMLHEMAHVRHGHSWDALFVALTEVLQWFNPCIWMLDTSLREVHEYEADDAVLRRGITARNYQLLLIKNAVRGSGYAFANAFNHSLLKKRITMMMKKKSSKWARMRLLYVVPATLIVLGAFASHRFVNQTAPLSNENAATVALPNQTSATSSTAMEKEELPNPEQEKPMNDVATEEMDTQTLPPMPINTLQDTSVVRASNGKQIYEVADEMPEYPGGMSALMGYLTSNVKYPKIAQEHNVQGRYIVRFCVTSEGKIENVEIARKPQGESLSEINVVGYSNEADSVEVNRRINQAKGLEALEEEALRVVKDMPDWKPGKVKGEPVNCLFNLPITFRLQ